jgi:hypothetical protein
MENTLNFELLKQLMKEVNPRNDCSMELIQDDNVFKIIVAWHKSIQYVSVEYSEHMCCFRVLVWFMKRGLRYVAAESTYL